MLGLWPYYCSDSHEPSASCLVRERESTEDKACFLLNSTWHTDTHSERAEESGAVRVGVVGRSRNAICVCVLHELLANGVGAVCRAAQIGNARTERSSPRIPEKLSQFRSVCSPTVN